MTERKTRKKAQATKPVKQTVEGFPKYSPPEKEDVFKIFFNNLSKYCLPLRGTPYTHSEESGEGVICIPYDAPVTHEEGASDVKSYVFISFAHVDYGVGIPSPLEADQGDEKEKKAIQKWLSEIDLSIKRMRRDQTEIDRLKEETRAAIARLKVA